MSPQDPTDTASTEHSYGTWPSEITSDLLVRSAVGLGGPALSAGDVWWSELRPSEGGRVQLVRKRAHDDPEDLLPDGFSARTRVHEYGGGAWWLHGETMFFTNWEDQRLYRIDPKGSPVPLTPEPSEPGADRYADGRCTKDGRWIVCVRERHTADGQVLNELVGVLGDQDGSSEPLEPVVLRSHADFVSNPRLSSDDEMMCWLEWDLPRMPWEGTELWVAGLDTVGESISMHQPERVLGGAEVSLAQPRWNPTGELSVVSDEDGWWNLWSFPRPARPTPDTARQVTKVPGELAEPQWVFGQSDWAITPTGHLVGCWRYDGVDHLGIMRRDTWGEVEWVPLPYTSIDGLATGDGSEVAFVAASFTQEPQVVSVDADLLGADREPPLTIQRPARDLGISQDWFAVPEAVTFPTGDGEQAHALVYPPTNPNCTGPADERSPLLVLSHGGPTGAARPMLNLAVQYWTSRGWTVADVNYRGSVGYGREYRQLLEGRWGVADVEDCVAVAGWLADQGRVDRQRLVIKGGSAGGFTTLAALTFHDTFSAGSSHYGVADLEMLAADTHKFESRYLEFLVGPYPERQDLYRERSPIQHVEELSCPLVVLQGAEDQIVPPNQAERIVEALRGKGLPVAYLLFEGEQHGFRKAESIKQAIEAERYFFSRVLDIEGEPADGDTGAQDQPPVVIENLKPA